MANELLRLTDRGIYCAAGDFYVDPWRPVERAVVTHAHADHARWGSRVYLTTNEGERVLRRRMGAEARIETLPYGGETSLDGVKVSLHPAGHILGSAQVRVEHRGEVWVVSGDYKTEPDPTATPFEPVACHGFVTESTFGLPIYTWPKQQEVFAEINAWWRAMRDAGRASILYAYSLGKAQRLLAGVDPSIGPIYTHGAVEKLTADYRAGGVDLPPTTYVGEAVAEGKKDWAGALVVAPPSTHGTPWMRRFGNASTGFASGWMRLRGTRRRRGVERGFVLSDHADWPGLLDAIEATGAERIWVTHGYRDPLVRWLREGNLDASSVETRFEGEAAADDEEAEVEVAAAREPSGAPGESAAP